MTQALEVETLSKHYKAHPALTDVSLSVPEGELLALLGHNGAGKTTLVKLLLGLTRPTAGTLRVLGKDPAGRRAAELRRAIGYLPENVSFAEGMTGREALRFYCKLKGADRAEAAALLERVGLTDAAGRPVRTYSKGMRQRLGLAQALIGRPRLLLLDEPTTGLDPVLRQGFFDILADLRAGGTTILLSSHVLTELEMRTDRVAILRDGHLVACDTLPGLRRRANLPVRIRVTSDTADRVAEQFGAQATRINGRSVELAVDVDQKMQAVRRLTEVDGAVQDLEILPPSLDEVYAHFGHRAITDQKARR